MTKKHFVYFTLQLKRIVKLWWRLMIGAIVLTLVVGAIAFYATKLLYGQQSAQQITVALVVDDDSALMDLGMTYLESSESINSFCRLLRVSKEEADRMLANHEVAASMYFPPDFARDVARGKNTPAQITFADKTGIEQLLFDELTAAASRILIYAQSGVYSFEDVYSDYDFEESKGSNIDYLNENLLQIALVRANFYENRQVSATGELGLGEYYIVSAIVLFVLLLALSMGFVALPEKGSFAACMSQQGLRGGFCVFYKQLALCILYVAIFGLAAVIGAYMGMFSWKNIVILPILAVFVSSRTVFYYTLTANETTGTLLMFVATLGSVFVSGCLVPASFMPGMLRNVGQCLPPRFMHELLRTIFTDAPIGKGIYLLAYSVGFLGMAVIVQRRREMTW